MRIAGLGQAFACAAALACGSPRPAPPVPQIAPLQVAPPKHAGPIVDEDDDERPPPDITEQTTLDKELEAAYADRRPDKMQELRARAEKLSGQPAVIGIAGDFVANVAGKLVVTGVSGATILDASNAPVGWFDISQSKERCPPCEANARTIVAVPLAAKLVALLPQRLAYGAIIVDAGSMQTVARLKANLTSIAVAPGKQLATVELEYQGDPSECRGVLAIVNAAGSVQRRPPLVAPKDFCMGQTAGSLRAGKLVVSADWSEELLTVDLATGKATHTKPSQPHTPDSNRHHSRTLCGLERERVKTSGCSVAARWVFPSHACAGAKSQADEHASTVCSPDFRGL